MMILIKKIGIGIVFLLLLEGTVSCAVYETKSTVQVFTYSPPRIAAATVIQNGIEITIATDMYYPNHEDFNYFVLLYGSVGTDFQSDINNTSMKDLTEINQIPYYLTNTGRPSVSGNYLNPTTITVNWENFEILQTYDLAVIAYGYNESFGRLYDNNGWLYSKVSSTHTLHIPIITNGTITDGDALVWDANEWKVSNDNVEDRIKFNFSTNINDINIDAMVPIGSLGINPLGNGNSENSDSLSLIPEDNYVSGEENYFSLISGYDYALKNITENIYARLHINSLDSMDKRFTFRLIYSTQVGQRNF